MNFAPWMVVGAVVFLLAMLALLALFLVLEVWSNRANVRANLPRACAAVCMVVVMFVLLDKWDGVPFHLDAPIIVSFVIAAQVLTRRYPSKSHS
jgi:hypothetical protein